jgi:hypothetical protein
MPDPESFELIFLLGVISSKWWINHNKKQIRIYLPESKRYLAQALKLEWGGSVSSITRSKYHGIVWQTTSNRSLKKIAEAAKEMRPWLPLEFYQQLSAFMQEHL